MSLISLKTREARGKSWFAVVMLCEKRIHFRPEGNSQLLDILWSPCSKEFFFLFHNPWDEEKLRCLLMAIGNYSDDGRCESIKS